MLKRAHRLPSSVRFSRSRILRYPLLSIKYVPSLGPLSRVSIIASKRVDKRAVVRNSLKRVISAQLTTVLPTWKTTYDMLIIINPAATKVEKTLFTQEVADIFRGLSL